MRACIAYAVQKTTQRQEIQQSTIETLVFVYPGLKDVLRRLTSSVNHAIEGFIRQILVCHAFLLQEGRLFTFLAPYHTQNAPKIGFRLLKHLHHVHHVPLQATQILKIHYVCQVMSII